jgi:histidyl-tRNA synthetase
VKLLWNDRGLVEKLFTLAGVPAQRFAFAFYLLDRIAKLAPEQRTKLYAENGITEPERAFFEKLAAGKNPLANDFWEGTGADFKGYAQTIAETQAAIERTLGLMGLGGYAIYDASIVRGLAYYTGFVFEVADTRGENRAIAGGGRYDRLIEMFGGAPLPATGFGMGDVVLAILLNELGKMPTGIGATADVFVINALPAGEEAMKLAGALRASTWDPAAKRVGRAGLNVGVSYKATKNIGKLLQDASASGATVAVILAPAEWERGMVKVKNLVTREEKEVRADAVVAEVRGMVG